MQLSLHGNSLQQFATDSDSDVACAVQLIQLLSQGLLFRHRRPGQPLPIFRQPCGAWKVLWAAICAGFGKLVGKHGIFYDMVGMEVTGLDGFYPDVFPVYGDYGIRIPENPSGVCNEIYEKTGVRAMIVDANDFTRDILGKGDNVTLTDEQLCEIIRDNPAGQDDQCTPFILIRKKQ